MQSQDPLEQAEKSAIELQQAIRKSLHPAHRKYPLLFLFLITFSIAGVFHGFDLFVDTIPFFQTYPLALVALGVLGLFTTGALYKRLGKDKFD